MGSKQPKPTDPRSIADATTSSGIGTAIANTWLGNMSETGPLGSTSVAQTGTQSYTDPYTGRTYSLPTFTRNTTLNPVQQDILNNNQAATLKTASAGYEASKDLMGTFSNPISLAGAPDPTQDFSADRQKVEDALMARLNPQLDRDRQSLETNLANRGISIGSDAYTRAVGDFGQTTNDARIAAILNAGQEQNRLYGLSSAERTRQMQEQIGLRNQQLNETQQLMGGGQASMPSFMGGNAGQIAPTNIAGLINNYDQQRMQGYQQQQSNMGGLLGGLGSLAGMFMLSDERAKEDIEKVGKTKDGLGLYSYRYKGSPTTQVGLMAQEVKKKKPDAVMTGSDGLMRVNYKKALS
jgi:hypothetical protein